MKPSKSAVTVTLIQDREVFQTTYREANRERANAQHLGRRCASKERSLFAEPITPDDPRDDEVLIRIAGVGMCHTDLVVRHQYFPTPPAVLGHEGAGVVEKVGQVAKVAEGDAVVLSFASCGVCANCQSGRYGPDPIDMALAELVSMT